jgi:hypothetical protein
MKHLLLALISLVVITGCYKTRPVFTPTQVQDEYAYGTPSYARKPRVINGIVTTVGFAGVGLGGALLSDKKPLLGTAIGITGLIGFWGSVSSLKEPRDEQIIYQLPEGLDKWVIDYNNDNSPQIVMHSCEPIVDVATEVNSYIFKFQERPAFQYAGVDIWARKFELALPLPSLTTQGIHKINFRYASESGDYEFKSRPGLNPNTIEGQYFGTGQNCPTASYIGRSSNGLPNGWGSMYLYKSPLMRITGFFIDGQIPSYENALHSAYGGLIMNSNVKNYPALTTGPKLLLESMEFGRDPIDTTLAASMLLSGKWYYENRYLK